MSDWKTLDLLTPEDQTRARGLFKPGEDVKIEDYEFSQFGPKLLRRVRPEIVDAALKKSDEVVAAAAKGASQRQRVKKEPQVPLAGRIEPLQAGDELKVVDLTDRIVRLALNKIVESATNPRTNYNEAKLVELAGSIQESGIIQPLIVRRLEYRIVPPAASNWWYIEFRASGGDWKPLHRLVSAPFEKVECCLLTREEAELKINELPVAEIVAGHRRYRGAGIAGIADAPVIYRTLTDAQVLEIQLIENLQREDLDPIEEAEGLARALTLKDEGGAARFTHESLAKRLGFESVQTIHDRIRLLRLPDTAKKAIQSALIGVAVGYLIAKVPNMAMRKRLTTEVLRGNGDDSIPSTHRPMSWREAHDHIRRNYVKLLRQSETPFDMANATLVPVKMDGEERMFGGACTDCPHNSANTPEAGEQKFPFCTLVTCYLLKVDAHMAVETKAALDSGAVVVSADGAREYLEPDGTPKHGTGMVDITAKPLPGEVIGQGKAPPWREMIEGKTVTESIVTGRDAEGGKVMGNVTGTVDVPKTVVFDEKGKAHHLVKRSVAIAAASKNGFGHLFPAASSEGKAAKAAGKTKRDTTEADAKKLTSAIGAASMAALVDEIERLGLARDGIGMAMLDAALFHSGSDGLEFVCTRRNLGEGDRETLIRKHAKVLGQQALQALVVEVLLAGMVRLQGAAAGAFLTFAKVYSLNLKGIAAGVKAAGKKPRGKPDVPIRDLIHDLAQKRGLKTLAAIDDLAMKTVGRPYDVLQGPELTAVADAIKALPVPEKKKPAKGADPTPKERGAAIKTRWTARGKGASK